MMSYAEKRQLLRDVRAVIREELALIFAETTPPGDIISISEAASQYGISLSGLYKNWKKLGGYKYGGKVFISRRNIEDKIKGKTN